MTRIDRDCNDEVKWEARREAMTRPEVPPPLRVHQNCDTEATGDNSAIRTDGTKPGLRLHTPDDIVVLLLIILDGLDWRHSLSIPWSLAECRGE